MDVQDIRAAMSLLDAMPSVNLQLWAQLARAAGRHGFWLLAMECASAALGALSATKPQLHTITTAADVPEVTAQGWYWLSVAEMQQGQVSLSETQCDYKHKIAVTAAQCPSTPLKLRSPPRWRIGGVAATNICHASLLLSCRQH